MRISDIPKTWKHTGEGVWHQPRYEVKWTSKRRLKKKKYLVWAVYYEKKCERCKTPCVLTQKWRKYCTSNCANKAIAKFGKDHPRWKNGRAEIASGYVLIKVGYKKYIFEHRLKMEAHLGRKLSIKEVIHHKNGIRNDNRIRNLVVMTRAEHASHHHSRHKPPMEVLSSSEKPKKWPK